MTQRLPHLHDPYDGGVNLVLAVLENALLRRFLLIICLFQLDLNRNLELEVFSLMSSSAFTKLALLRNK